MINILSLYLYLRSFIRIILQLLVLSYPIGNFFHLHYYQNKQKVMKLFPLYLHLKIIWLWFCRIANTQNMCCYYHLYITMQTLKKAVNLKYSNLTIKPKLLLINQIKKWDTLVHIARHIVALSLSFITSLIYLLTMHIFIEDATSSCW